VQGVAIKESVVQGAAEHGLAANPMSPSPESVAFLSLCISALLDKAASLGNETANSGMHGDAWGRVEKPDSQERL